MSRIGICGGSYQSIAFSADNQNCINFMAEKVESGAGKSEIILIGTPGLKTFCTLADSPLRGEWRTNTPSSTGRGFAVAGSTLFEVFSNGTSVALGTVANDGKPASLASSSIQLMVASGGQAYCYTFSTGILTGPIATLAGVTQVIETDGFFVAVIAYSARIFVSPPLDGINWDPAQTALVSVFPDNIVSMNLLVRQVCLLGTKKSVCYYDSGNTFPYDVVPGGTNEQGSAAIFGTTVADNTIFGIWADERGGRVAFRAQGYTFQRVSTHAIELAWQSYTTVSDAVCYSYQERGHTFVVWYFPSAAGGNGRTWVYDIATGLWHERGFFVNGIQYAHRSMCHMLAFEKHLVGDPLSGNIYEMAESISDGAGGWNFADDFGNPIIRERTSPFFGVAGIWNYIDEVEILADTGLGPNIPFTTDGLVPAANASNWRGPKIMLRYSKDGGQNWSNERDLDMGQIGKFGKRIISRRLGRFWGSNGMLLKLNYSDSAPIRIVDLDVTGTPDMRPQKRLPQEIRERA